MSIVEYRPQTQDIVRDRERASARRNLDAVAAQIPVCESAIEAWELADRAEAIGGAIKAWKLGADMVWEAAELALRAYRQTGHLLGKAKVGGDGSNQYRAKSPRGEIALSRDDRLRCRQLAEPPEERFEGYLADRRAKYADNSNRVITLRRALADLTGRTEKRGRAANPIKPDDNWNFSRLPAWCDKIDGGQENEPGYLPGLVYANILHYWSRPGDKVCAPMAGSGMIRQVYEHREEWMEPEPWELDIEMFDLVPRGPWRDQIRENDAIVGIPSSEPDLIVADIPYFGMCKGVYSKSTLDLGNMDIGAYSDALMTFASNCHSIQKEDGTVVIITAARFVDHKAGEVVLLDKAVIAAFEAACYSLVDQAFSSRRIQQTQTPTMAMMNNRAREMRLMLSDMLVVLAFKRGSA